MVPDVLNEEFSFKITIALINFSINCEQHFTFRLLATLNISKLPLVLDWISNFNFSLRMPLCLFLTVYYLLIIIFDFNFFFSENFGISIGNQESALPRDHLSAILRGEPSLGSWGPLHAKVNAILREVNALVKVRVNRRVNTKLQKYLFPMIFNLDMFFCHLLFFRHPI